MAASHAGLGLAAHVTCCVLTEIVLKKHGAEVSAENSLLFEKESHVRRVALINLSANKLRSVGARRGRKERRGESSRPEMRVERLQLYTIS